MNWTNLSFRWFSIMSNHSPMFTVQCCCWVHIVLLRFHHLKNHTRNQIFQNATHKKGPRSVFLLNHTLCAVLSCLVYNGVVSSLVLLSHSYFLILSYLELGKNLIHTPKESKKLTNCTVNRRTKSNNYSYLKLYLIDDLPNSCGGRV